MFIVDEMKIQIPRKIFDRLDSIIGQRLLLYY